MATKAATKKAPAKKAAAETVEETVEAPAKKAGDDSLERIEAETKRRQALGLDAVTARECATAQIKHDDTL